MGNLNYKLEFEELKREIKEWEFWSNQNEKVLQATRKQIKDNTKEEMKILVKIDKLWAKQDNESADVLLDKVHIIVANRYDKLKLSK